MLRRVQLLVARISLSVFGTIFRIRVDYDREMGILVGRVFVQIAYDAPCEKTGEIKEWHSRKWYLSEHMTDDEIVKTCYAAFEATVKHEVMEGFKVDNITLFNPHVDFEELLKISHKEVKRNDRLI